MKMVNLFFCEHDFIVTNYIGEFYNTISHIPWFYFIYKKYRHNSHKDIKVAYFLFTIVGIVSTLFHSTLNYYMLRLDEMSMILFTWYLYYLIFRNNWLYAIQFKIISQAMILHQFIYCAFLSHELFVLTFQIFATAVGGTYWHYYRQNPKGLIYIAAGAIAWTLDEKYKICEYTIIPLHAFWHILISLAVTQIINNIGKNISNELAT